MKNNCKLNMKNYYFKFGYSNNLFENLLKEKIIRDNKAFEVGDSIDLAIFFNKTFDNENWTVEDWKNDKVTTKKDSNYEQIDYFLSCPDSNSNSYLWLFNKGKVYVFEPTSQPWTGDVGYYDHIKKINGKDYVGERPKFITIRIKEIFEKTDLPESFSTINANQKYNRKTIKILENVEAEIAKHLIDFNLKKKKKIYRNESFKYLSPIQFETLIFLIFHHNNYFVTTYRGGTRKDIDLVIQPYGKFGMFNEKGKSNLQIKKKDNTPKLANEVDIYIYLGKKDDENNKIFGETWINKQLKNEDINKWLDQSLEFFEIVD